MSNNEIMAKAAAKAGAAVKVRSQKASPTAYVQRVLDAKMAEIKKALPSVMTPERFARITLSAISANGVLAEAAVTSPMTLLGSVMTAAQLGVEPNTPLGQAYLIPRKRKGVWEVQFQLGYKGLIDLAYRSGEVTMIQAHCVYSNDLFEYELGIDPKLRHVPASGERGELTHAYATFRTKGGATGFACMSRHDIEQHRDRYSDAARGGFSPWATQFEEMAKKTVLKAALKYAPLKSDFAREMAADGAVKAQVDADMSSVRPVEAVEAEAVVVEAEGSAAAGAADDGGAGADDMVRVAEPGV